MGNVCEVYNPYVWRLLGSQRPPRKYRIDNVLPFRPVDKAVKSEHKAGVVQPKINEFVEIPLELDERTGAAFAKFGRGEQVEDQLLIISSYFKKKRDDSESLDEPGRAQANRQYGIFHALHSSEKQLKAILGGKSSQPSLISEINNGLRISLDIAPQFPEIDNSVSGELLDQASVRYANNPSKPYIYYLIGNNMFIQAASANSDIGRDEADNIIEIYKKVIELKPDFIPAYLRLVEFYKKINKPLEAHEISWKADVILDPK